MQGKKAKTISMQCSSLLENYKATCFNGRTEASAPKTGNDKTQKPSKPNYVASKPSLQNFAEANNLLQRREEKALKLSYKLQHVRDSHAILCSNNKSIMPSALMFAMGNNEKHKKSEAKKDGAIIDKYKKGEATYEEVDTYLDRLDSTCSTVTNTAINICTGLSAMTAGISTKAATLAKEINPKTSKLLVLGTTIAVGALTKTVLSLLERSRNNIEGDEFNIIQIGKDLASGACNGIFSGFNACVGKQITSGFILKKLGFETAKQGVMIGIQKEYKKKQREKSDFIAF